MYHYAIGFADILSENSIPRDSDSVNSHLPSSLGHSNASSSENFRREAKTAFVALAEARRLKKMVRFYGSRQSTNDSGIDMGSSVCTSTSVEDSNTFSKVHLYVVETHCTYRLCKLFVKYGVYYLECSLKMRRL